MPNTNNSIHKQNKGSVSDHIAEMKQDLEVRAELALLDIAEVLANTVRVRRDELNLTQKQLADLLGTKQGRVSALEDQFYTRHTLLSLAKVADVLGCKLFLNLIPYAANNNVVKFRSFCGFNIPLVDGSEAVTASLSSEISKNIEGTVLKPMSLEAA
jgi:transcriptional regulator with XRE-family HTH domain